MTTVEGIKYMSLYLLVFIAAMLYRGNVLLAPAEPSEMVSALSTNRIASGYPDVEAYRRIRQVHEVRGKKQTTKWELGLCKSI